MTPKELAAILNGREYLKEITREESAHAKAAGLVVVFGASDDLMEFCGAIYDEASAYDGGTAYVDSKGLLADLDNIEDEDELKDYFVRKPASKAIEAIWSPTPELSWAYKTEIPHETFDIMEDGETYCRGIVFALSDLAPAETTEERLTAIVRAFIDEHHVSCAETIYQSDRVIENAYQLIEKLADVVGYYQDQDSI